MRAFRLAYDGTAFRGFQRQPDVPTVEDALFDALTALGIHETGAGGRSRPPPAGYAAAGRTDASASALAQTVAFEAPEWCRPRALNAELPAAVRAWASADVTSEFHATHDARSRTYVYHLHAPDADPALARQALATLSGRHDVDALTPDDGGERTLSADLRVDAPYLVVRVRAGGFPRQLVRRAVSLVDGVARGERPVADVERVLSGAVPDHARPGPAPAEPLVLADVAYGVAFEIDPRAAASAREVFERRQIERRTGARIAGVLADGVGDAGPCDRDG